METAQHHITLVRAPFLIECYQVRRARKANDVSFHSKRNPFFTGREHLPLPLKVVWLHAPSRWELAQDIVQVLRRAYSSDADDALDQSGYVLPLF